MQLSTFTTLCAVLCLVPVAMATEQPVAVNPRLQEAVKLPAFLTGKTFYIADVAGSVGNASVTTARGTTSPTPIWLPVQGVIIGREFAVEDVNWQRDPREIVRDALVSSFESAGALAKDEDSADYSVSITVHRFGFVEATWREYYSKLEMTATVKNQRTGVVTSVPAFGTSIVQKEQARKKVMQATQSGLETALRRGVANFLYSAKLKTAME